MGSTVRFGLALKFAATTILVAAGAVLLPVSPAAAAVCPGATGVTVVVDFNQLGGGVKTGCAATGGGKACVGQLPGRGLPPDLRAAVPRLRLSGLGETHDRRLRGHPTGHEVLEPVVVGRQDRQVVLLLARGRFAEGADRRVRRVLVAGSGRQVSSGLTPTKRAGLVPAPSDPASSEPPKAPKPTKSPSKSPTKSPSKSPSKPAQQPGQVRIHLPPPPVRRHPQQVRSHQRRANLHLFPPQRAIRRANPPTLPSRSMPKHRMMLQTMPR